MKQVALKAIDIVLEVPEQVQCLATCLVLEPLAVLVDYQWVADPLYHKRMRPADVVLHDTQWVLGVSEADEHLLSLAKGIYQFALCIHWEAVFKSACIKIEHVAASAAGSALE